MCTALRPIRLPQGDTLSRAHGPKGENSSGSQTAFPRPYRQSRPKGNGHFS